MDSTLSDVFWFIGWRQTQMIGIGLLVGVFYVIRNDSAVSGLLLWVAISLLLWLAGVYVINTTWKEYMERERRELRHSIERRFGTRTPVAKIN